MPSKRRRPRRPDGSVGGHFLESAAARQFDPLAIARMSEDEATEMFVADRWAEHDGKPVCPHEGCGHDHVYDMIINRRLKSGVKKVRIFKCAACRRQFSPTSGTRFAYHKRDLRDYFAAMALWITGVKGMAAYQMQRASNQQAKSAFVLEHKLRESLEYFKQVHRLGGEVEVDGIWFGGVRRQANEVAKRRHSRVVPDERQSAVVIRQRNGEARAFVFPAEHLGVKWVMENLDPTAKVFTDDAPHWNALHAFWDVKTINHSKFGFWTIEAHTNGVESTNSRFRRAQYGVYHRIAGKHVPEYVTELTWRENNRRQSMGEHWRQLLRAVTHMPMSKRWTGYWNYAGRARTT